MLAVSQAAVTPMLGAHVVNDVILTHSDAVTMEERPEPGVEAGKESLGAPASAATVEGSEAVRGEEGQGQEGDAPSEGALTQWAPVAGPSELDAPVASEVPDAGHLAASSQDASELPLNVAPSSDLDKGAGLAGEAAKEVPVPPSSPQGEKKNPAGGALAPEPLAGSAVKGALSRPTAGDGFPADDAKKAQMPPPQSGVSSLQKVPLHQQAAKPEHLLPGNSQQEVAPQQMQQLSAAQRPPLQKQQQPAQQIQQQTAQQKPLQQMAVSQQPQQQMQPNTASHFQSQQPQTQQGLQQPQFQQHQQGPMLQNGHNQGMHNQHQHQHQQQHQHQHQHQQPQQQHQQQPQQMMMSPQPQMVHMGSQSQQHQQGSLTPQQQPLQGPPMHQGPPMQQGQYQQQGYQQQPTNGSYMMANPSPAASPPRAMMIQQPAGMVSPGFAPGDFGSWAPFTTAQWHELEQQAMVFKYLVAGAPVPQELVDAMRMSLAGSMAGQPGHLVSFGQPMWGAAHVDPEPFRCRRTDGKKWRCSREVVAEQKYCERHMHRGRNRARKTSDKSTPGNSLVSADDMSEAPTLVHKSGSQGASEVAGDEAGAGTGAGAAGAAAVKLDRSESMVGVSSGGPPPLALPPAAQPVHGAAPSARPPLASQPPQQQHQQSQHLVSSGQQQYQQPHSALSSQQQHHPRMGQAQAQPMAHHPSAPGQGPHVHSQGGPGQGSHGYTQGAPQQRPRMSPNMPPVYQAAPLQASQSQYSGPYQQGPGQNGPGSYATQGHQAGTEQQGQQQQWMRGPSGTMGYQQGQPAGYSQNGYQSFAPSQNGQESHMPQQQQPRVQPLQQSMSSGYHQQQQPQQPGQMGYSQQGQFSSTGQPQQMQPMQGSFGGQGPSGSTQTGGSMQAGQYAMGQDTQRPVQSFSQVNQQGSMGGQGVVYASQTYSQGSQGYSHYSQGGGSGYTQQGQQFVSQPQQMQHQQPYAGQHQQPYGVPQSQPLSRSESQYSSQSSYGVGPEGANGHTQPHYYSSQGTPQPQQQGYQAPGPYPSSGQQSGHFVSGHMQGQGTDSQYPQQQQQYSSQQQQQQQQQHVSSSSNPGLGTPGEGKVSLLRVPNIVSASGPSPPPSQGQQLVRTSSQPQQQQYGPSPPAPVQGVQGGSHPNLGVHQMAGGPNGNANGTGNGMRSYSTNDLSSRDPSGALRWNGSSNGPSPTKPNAGASDWASGPRAPPTLPYGATAPQFRHGFNQKVEHGTGVPPLRKTGDGADGVDQSMDGNGSSAISPNCVLQRQHCHSDTSSAESPMGPLGMVDNPMPTAMGYSHVTAEPSVEGALVASRSDT